MADAKENARLAERVWNATAEGDRVTLLRYLTPDVVWHAYGQNPLSGDYLGPEGVFEYLASAGERVDELQTELRGIYAGEQGAVIDFHIVAARGDKHLEMDYLLTLRVRDDRIEELRTVPVDQRQTDAFWS